MNRNRDSGFDFLGETHRVPIGKANATMTHGVSDCLRLVRPMDADAFFVERDPDHADATIGTWRQHIEIAAALAVLKHLLVVTKAWQLRDAADFPLPNRR